MFRVNCFFDAEISAPAFGKGGNVVAHHVWDCRQQHLLESGTRGRLYYVAAIMPSGCISMVTSSIKEWGRPGARRDHGPSIVERVQSALRNDNLAVRVDTASSGAMSILYIATAAGSCS